MKQSLIFCALLSGSFLLSACSGPGKSHLPLKAGIMASNPEKRLVWVGQSKAFKFEQGQWRRTPAQDYDFSVIQDRFGRHWESVKEMHRRHKDYDGSAGPRDQTHFFRVNYGARAPQGRVAFDISSSMGVGTGNTDPEFRKTNLELKADVSSFAPFNTFRLTQHYKYEQGLLTETVYLFKRDAEGKEIPFARMEEKAYIFTGQKLKGAPTRFQGLK